MVEHKNPYISGSKDNKPHRTNGPAIKYKNGDFFWCLNGTWHRYYGPATFLGDWWIHDKYTA